MTRTTLYAACLLAAASPAMAAATPDCSGLAAARTAAHAAAASAFVQVTDLDGDKAHAFQKAQQVPLTNGEVDHLSIMMNPGTGHGVVLLNDGPRCAFSSVIAGFIPSSGPLDSALDLLRVVR